MVKLYMQDGRVKEYISAERIAVRVRELGERISDEYRETSLLYVVGVLDGAFMFVADLVRHIQVPCRIGFIEASSYGSGMRSRGQVDVRCNLDIAGCDVLLVEDILDTGLTLHEIVGEFDKLQPASVQVCVLLDKPSQRRYPLEARYVGFDIPDRFVVGYGTDFDGRYRELPYIGYLENPDTGGREV